MDLASALDRLQNVPPVDWQQQWDAIQEVQWWLDELKQDLQIDSGPERLYPTTSDIPSEELALKIKEFSIELATREQEALQRDLVAARKIWSTLRDSLHKMKPEAEIYGEPQVVNGRVSVFLKSGKGRYDIKRKAEAIEFALNRGSGGWYTISDFYLWLAGSGPIVENTIKACGYASLKKISGVNC